MKNICLCACFLVFGPMAALSQVKNNAYSVDQVIPPFFSKVAGTWKASGTSFGMPSEVTMIWQPSLQGKFFHLNYKIIMHPKEGNDRVFEGVAYYRFLSEGTYQATWFDSNGELHPITAEFDGIAMNVTWGTPGVKLGKTVYKFVNDSSIEIVDSIQSKDGTWKEFARNTLIKQQ